MPQMKLMSKLLLEYNIQNFRIHITWFLIAMSGRNEPLVHIAGLEIMEGRKELRIPRPESYIMCSLRSREVHTCGTVMCSGATETQADDVLSHHDAR